MKWIKYQIICNEINEEVILLNKKLGYSEDNLAIAEKEAYNGEYTVVEDDLPVPSAPPSYIPVEQIGVKNGVASLDGAGKVPSGQLPAMNYLPIKGGSLAGPVRLYRHPETDMEPVSKIYMQDYVSKVAPTISKVDETLLGSKTYSVSTPGTVTTVLKTDSLQEFLVKVKLTNTGGRDTGNGDLKLTFGGITFDLGRVNANYVDSRNDNFVYAKKTSQGWLIWKGDYAGGLDSSCFEYHKLAEVTSFSLEDYSHSASSTTTVGYSCTFEVYGVGDGTTPKVEILTETVTGSATVTFAGTYDSAGELTGTEIATGSTRGNGVNSAIAVFATEYPELTPLIQTVAALSNIKMIQVTVSADSTEGYKDGYEPLCQLVFNDGDGKWGWVGMSNGNYSFSAYTLADGKPGTDSYVPITKIGFNAWAYALGDVTFDFTIKVTYASIIDD